MPLEPFVLQANALKASEVARRIGVERTTVYRWMSTGKLPFVEVGGTKYVLVGAYERFAERHAKRATLEEQAARYIGEGGEFAGEVALDTGLAAPSSREALISEDVGAYGSPEDARQLLRATLDGYEARFGVTSEHVHRERIVEGHVQIEGVPDAVAASWAHCYSAYVSLSLIRAQ